MFSKKDTKPGFLIRKEIILYTPNKFFLISVPCIVRREEGGVQSKKPNWGSMRSIAQEHPFSSTCYSGN